MVLKFFDVVLKFELPNAGVLNFPKNSALVLIRLVLINGDCVYDTYYKGRSFAGLDIYKLYFLYDMSCAF